MSRKRRPARHKPAPVQRTDVQQAEELEALARKYPQDQEEILTEAAEFYNRAGQHEKALALYQEVLDAKCEEPHLVQAFRIDALWDAGRQDEAREAARDLRREHPADAGPWNVVAEKFETADELHDAADYFTAGVTHLLGPCHPSHRRRRPRRGGCHRDRDARHRPPPRPTSPRPAARRPRPTGSRPLRGPPFPPPHRQHPRRPTQSRAPSRRQRSPGPDRLDREALPRGRSSPGCPPLIPA